MTLTNDQVVELIEEHELLAKRAEGLAVRARNHVNAKEYAKAEACSQVAIATVLSSAFSLVLRALKEDV
jgi:hypothetical protein